MEVSSQLYIPAVLPPEKESTSIPWIRGWVSSKTGLDDEERRKISPLPELKLRRRGRPVRNQSLYRLRYPSSLSRAMAPEVRCWLPTKAALVRARVWSCGICGGQSGTGTGFLWILPFPLPIFIPPIVPQSPSSIIWGWYNRPVVAAV
jgi:hypothetical protein